MYKVKCSAAWTRTKDPSLNRGSLYQLSYRGMFSLPTKTATRNDIFFHQHPTAYNCLSLPTKTATAEYLTS